jgi:hypothetical protein
MEPQEIIDALGAESGFPVEAIRAADAQRDIMAPLFIDLIERQLAGTAGPREEMALFFVFHLLGSWRVKAAYRPVLRLVRLPESRVEFLLSDAITETLHRVVANLFDGDLEPLREAILDADAYQFVRSGLFDTVVMLAAQGKLTREAAVGLLTDCADSLRPRDCHHAWAGWQSAVAAFALEELRPRVKAAFDEGLIDPLALSFKDFVEDLEAAKRAPTLPLVNDHRYFSPFGDTVEELSSWSAFGPDANGWRDSPGRSAGILDPAPRINPLRDVGRNAPCPCGSGLKYKKCCLARIEAGLPLRSRSG